MEELFLNVISYTSLFNKTVCINYIAQYTRSKSTNKITINKSIINKDSIWTIENINVIYITKKYLQKQQFSMNLN